MDTSRTTADGSSSRPRRGKRTRPCDACRRHKVRCEPQPSGQGPCMRCARAGRRCIVGMRPSSRGRQKRANSRISELERKIGALTTTIMRARDRRDMTSSTPCLENLDSDVGEEENDGDDDYETTMDSRFNSSTGRREEDQAAAASLSPVNEPETPSAALSARDNHQAPTPEPEAFTTTSSRGMANVSLTEDLASVLFQRFTDTMAPHFPAVIFASGTTAVGLRRARPILFLAIMAAASFEEKALQSSLQRELMAVLADKTFVKPEKTLEVVQAVIVMVVWYHLPDDLEEPNFYQLVHTACVMAIDIGLHQKHEESFTAWGPARGRRRPDSTAIESRRTWLACYFLSCTTAMALNRPRLIRWSPFMSESLEELRLSPDASVSDMYLCKLVQQHQLVDGMIDHHVMQDVAMSYRMNKQGSSMGYEQLGAGTGLESSVTDDHTHPLVEMGLHFTTVHLHRTALESFLTSATDKRETGFDGPGPRSRPREAASKDAAAAICLTSIKAVFDTFIHASFHSCDCLPTYAFARLVTCAVLLIKMQLKAAKAVRGGRLAGVYGTDDLRAEFYIDALVGKMQRLSHGSTMAKFLHILTMLRSWMLRQEEAAIHADVSAPATHHGAAQTNVILDSGPAGRTDTSFDAFRATKEAGQQQTQSAPSPSATTLDAPQCSPTALNLDFNAYLSGEVEEEFLDVNMFQGFLGL